LHVGVEEALAQNALADHTCRSEEKNVHGFNATGRLVLHVTQQI
jgi:hypothetical protein